MTRRKIPRRIRALFACEGESERSYGRWLQDILNETDCHVSLTTMICGSGGGDPLHLVEETVAAIARERKRSRAFKVAGLLLDTDLLGKDLDRDHKAKKLAGVADVHLVRQEPDHEAFLLRHLPGCRELRPPEGVSLATLRKKWPDYKKNTSAIDLHKCLDVECLREALKVEKDLKEYLSKLGFR